MDYYTAAAVRELDRRAIEEQHIPGFELMRRAGQAAFTALRAHWPDASRLLVFCGTGNNGGDGFVIAALAAAAGMQVMVYLVGDSERIRGDARLALDMARRLNVPIHQGLPRAFPRERDAVIVDALLGTGLSGAVKEPYTETITAINASGLPVLAVDIPSGLCSDTGAVLGVCVKADLTVTFIGRKIGLVVGEGPHVCGTVEFDDLGVPRAVYAGVVPALSHQNSIRLPSGS